jgi:hypothetical protein
MEKSQAQWEAELRTVGYSWQQINRLTRMRLEHAPGRINLEKLPKVRREEFIRWLYRQGKLQS